MNPLIQFKTTPPLLITLALLCFALVQNTQAVNPPPDGGYPGANTAEGDDALFSLTSGIANTAVGFNALHDNTTGGFNVAIGSSALANNTTGNFNMAVGTDALRDNNANFNMAIGFRVLFLNTTGNHLTGIGAAALRNNTTASGNTAIGADALRENTTGPNNTAIGADAMRENTTGHTNTAVGVSALQSNTEGFQNTAIGNTALFSNVTGGDNTAIGGETLYSNTIGISNTAIGFNSLYGNTIGDSNTAIGRSALSVNTTGSNNSAVGEGALGDNDSGEFNVAIGRLSLQHNETGDSNTAIGESAGRNITGSGNVCIGAGVNGFAGESNITRIRNVYESPTTDRAVYVTADGRIGTLSSSRRYKEEIEPMNQASERLFALKPVTFRYKKGIDPARLLSFGLIAEEVAEISPELITRDKEGKPETVRYEAVNAMLLNEFLKEHREVQELKKQVAVLTAGLQKVSTQLAAASPSDGGLEASKFATGRIRRGGPAPQVVNNP